MKKAIILLLAAVTLLTLSGCGSLFEREYYYETPYSGDIGPRTDRATEVRNYNMLKTALTNMIVNHTETGELRFSNYNGSPSEDLAAACFEIKSAHPLGAYAVESMSYDISYVVSYYMANITVGYKRTAEELASIVYTSDAADFDRTVLSAAARFAPALVVRSYAPGVDEDYVHALLKRNYYDDPVTVVAEPEAEVTGYPAEGENRIFDVRFRYDIPAQQQVTMSMVLGGRLEAAARTMTESTQPELALEAAEYLTTVCEQGDPSAIYASMAYGPLVNGDANAKGYALAYRALCATLGIECTVVEGSFGTMGGEMHFWNIIALAGEHYHVDLSAFADDPDAAFLRSDDAIWGAYIWDTAAYPACNGPLTYAEVAGIPEPEEAEEAEGEGGEAIPAGTEPTESGTEAPVESEKPAESEPPQETEPPETPAPSASPSPEPTEPPGEGKEPAPDKPVGEKTS